MKSADIKGFFWKEKVIDQQRNSHKAIFRIFKLCLPPYYSKTQNIVKNGLCSNVFSQLSRNNNGVSICKSYHRWQKTFRRLTFFPPQKYCREKWNVRLRILAGHVCAHNRITNERIIKSYANVLHSFTLLDISQGCKNRERGIERQK